MPLEPGITLVHKPVGVTSFSIVRAAQDELERAGRKLPVCHGGTLDPFAHGLLLLLAGPATKLMDFLHEAPKTYVARVVWGVETDTGDAGGREVMRGDPSSLTPERLEAAVGPFLGWTEQVPPATSAKKIGGEPAYRKAHRGEAVVLPPSRVYLHEARWLEHQGLGGSRPTSTLRLVCRGGYYVRSLACDLGRALGCGAHLEGLERSAIGPWLDPGPDARVHLAGRAVLPWLPGVDITRREWDAIAADQSIPSRPLSAPSSPFPAGFAHPTPLLRAFHQAKLVALLAREDNTLRAARLFGRGC